MPLETTEDFFKLNNYLQVLKEESISLENDGTLYFQNNHVYIVYENNIIPNGPITIRHHPTQKNTDFIETIPPIKLAQRPILKDVEPPIFAELIKHNIETNKDAKLALNKFAKNLMENQHKENEDSSSYIFSFIINNHNLKDFINNIRNTQELVMHYSNLSL
ncbi:44808_t:CDS:2 [Gigaspora margarita]|uniref:44808_t:CDS:1 n=1 Tax=Gigaspora margarita TaxID=4874 RepID=A0ABN7USJ2_GIGMA|nr:44808_t:CDS:2 [Gigaspora margarita]